MAALRQDLESKLQQELLQTAQQVTNELQQDLAGRMQSFENRQRDAVGRELGSALDLEERELDQLAEEIEVWPRAALWRRFGGGAAVGPGAYYIW